MYEELSRLLAGELDPVSEALLRARIAHDPALARAWADMSALPDLLGGLSLDAPPPALAARLARVALPDVALDFEAPLPSFDDDLRDPADDTMDPEADVLRPSHPVRARAIARAPATTKGREAFLDRLLAESRPVAAPVRSVTRPAAPRRHLARQVGVTLLVAGMALAAGVVLGLQAPDAGTSPELAAIAISEGTTTVDGSVDVRAGDVHVRVDGRARVTVTPDWFASNPPSAATVVVVGDERVAIAAQAGTNATGGTLGTWALPAGPSSVGAAEPEQSYVATVTAGGPVAAVAPRVIVTVEVERGAAVIDPEGTAINVDAGESRSFDPQRRDVVVPGIATNAPLAPELGPSIPVGDEGKESRRHVVTLGGELVRGAQEHGHIGTANQMEESGPPDEYGILGEDERLFAALEEVPGTELLDLDCAASPCVAVFDYEGDDPAWRDRLGDALSTLLEADVSLTGSEVVVEGWSVELVAVTVGLGTADDVPVEDGDKRARKALDGIERELTE